MGEGATVISLVLSLTLSPALMEAYIDFPDEEIPESVLRESSERVTSLVQQITALLDECIGRLVISDISGGANDGAEEEIFPQLMFDDALRIRHE